MEGWARNAPRPHGAAVALPCQRRTSATAEVSLDQGVLAQEVQHTGQLTSSSIRPRPSHAARRDHSFARFPGHVQTAPHLLLTLCVFFASASELRTDSAQGMSEHISTPLDVLGMDVSERARPRRMIGSVLLTSGETDVTAARQNEVSPGDERGKQGNRGNPVTRQ